MFTLWCRQEAAGLRAGILGRLRDPIRAREVLLVVPSERWAGCLRREIVAETGIVLEDHILGWERVAAQVAADPRQLVIHGPERRAILRAILLGAPDRFPSLVFRDPEQVDRAVVTSGVLSRVSEAVERLMRNESCDRPNGPCSTPAEQVRLLAWNYRRSLEEFGARPSFHVQQQAWKRLDREAFRVVFPGVRVVVLDGFDAVEPLLLDGIRALAESAEECHVLLDLDLSEPERFPHLRAARELLLGAGARPASDWAKASPPVSEASTPAGLPAGHERPRLVQALSRAHEVRAIARFLRNEMESCAAAGVPFDPHDYLVCFPDLDHYADLVGETFRDLGVPCVLSVGVPVVRQPLWELVEQLCAAVVSGHAGDAVERLFLSPLLRRGDGNLFGVDVGALRRARRELAATGHTQAFLETLRRHIERLSLHVGTSRPPIEDDDAETAAPDLVSDLEVYRSLERGLSELLSTSTALEKEHSLSDWPGILLPVIDRLTQECDLTSPAGMSTAETSRFSRTRARIEDAARRLSACAQIVNGNGRIALDEYATLLRVLLHGVRVPAHVPFAAGVSVLGRMEVRGLRPKVLLAGGLVEGDFPRLRTMPLPVAGEPAGAAPAAGLQLSAERYLFEHFLGMSREQTILFVPRADGDDELLPCHFLEEYGLDVNAAEDADRLVPAGTDGVVSASDRIVSVARDCDETRETLPCVEASDCLEPTELDLLGNVAWNIAANRTRRSEHTLSALDGFLSDPVLLAIARERAMGQVYSASVLDLIVQCPFRYFAERVVGLIEAEDDEDGRMPVTVGLVAHSVLFDFYSGWIREGRGPVTAASRRDAAERIAVLVDDALARAALPDFTADLALRRLIGFGGKTAFIEGIGVGGQGATGDTVRGHLGMLGAFLEYEIRRYENAAVLPPRYFEVGFGMSGRLAEESQDDFSVVNPVTVDLGGVKIRVRGRADRVDADCSHFVLIDYKTGWRPGVTVQKEGWYVQLPLYLMVLNRVFADRGAALEPVGGIYYSLRPDVAKTDSHFMREDLKALAGLKKSRCMKDADFQAAMETVRQRIVAGIQRIRDGQFHVTLAGEKLYCDRCEFRRICRKDLERAERLVPAALALRV